jgi:hypothetical protein
VELSDQVIVVVEDLADAEGLREAGEGTGGGRFRLYVEERHGVNQHVAREGISEVVGAGVVVILDLVLLQDLPVLFLCVLRAVAASLEELKHLGGLHLIDLMS